MSQAMRMLAPTSHANETTIIFINQIRMKIGVMFGSPETTSGGESLKYYASQRVDVRRVEKLKEGTGKDIEFVGNVTRARVVKNKVAPPFRDAMFTIQYGLGIDKYSDLIDSATKEGIIKKAGAWFSYKDENIGQGKGKTSNYLQENPDVYIEIKQLLEELFVPLEGEANGLIEQPDVLGAESTL
jgi:recombination protein RecA